MLLSSKGDHSKSSGKITGETCIWLPFAFPKSHHTKAKHMAPILPRTYPHPCSVSLKCGPISLTPTPRNSTITFTSLCQCCPTSHSCSHLICPCNEIKVFGCSCTGQLPTNTATLSVQLHAVFLDRECFRHMMLMPLGSKPTSRS